MDFRHLLSGLLGAALGSFLTHAFHLQTKTAAQTDQILGAAPGTAQSILNAAEQVIVNDTVAAVDTTTKS